MSVVTLTTIPTAKPITAPTMASHVRLRSLIDQSRGAVRPQRGQTHSVTGSACEPFWPGRVCWPAQRVRSRIGPCQLGHSFGSSWVSSFASGKSRTS